MPLLKSQISNITIGSDDWKSARIGRFTSSKAHNLVGDKLSDKGMKYVRTRVFEYKSGRSCDTDFTTEATAHGQIYETAALRLFCAQRDIQKIISQKLIYGINDRFSSTPDGIILLGEIGEDSYLVQPIEVKCFQPEKHMECIECSTPSEIKRVDSNSYWQSIDQMIITGSLTGFLVYYHPDLPENDGGLNVITIKTSDLFVVADLNKLKENKDRAFAEFEKRIKKGAK